MSQPLIFTEHAATKVWELMKEDGNLNLKLRVYVTGGGCSGFQYGFTFSEESQPDDIIISRLIKITDSQHEGDDEGDDEGDAEAEDVDDDRGESEFAADISNGIEADPGIAREGKCSGSI